MKKTLWLIFMFFCFVTGCGIEKEVVTATANGGFEKITYPQTIPLKELEMELFEKNEKDKYIDFKLEGNFEVSIKNTGDDVIVGNKNLNIEECAKIEKLKKSFTTPINYLHMLEYSYFVCNINTTNLTLDSNTLSIGELTHNDIKWNYIINSKDTYSDINLVCKNQKTKKELIIKTSWFSNDIGLIMKNINFALDQLNLRM